MNSQLVTYILVPTAVGGWPVGQVVYFCYGLIDRYALSIDRAAPSRNLFLAQAMIDATIDGSRCAIDGWAQRTLDKDCRQAEEPKLLVDAASRFHLGRQRQHSEVICSGALLFSSRVLRPSLVTLCSHKSSRCVVELYHAPHLWYPPFYTSPMASSALQYWTASPTKEGCHWQAGGENCQTWQLANPVWYPSPLLRLTSRKPLWLDLQPVELTSKVDGDITGSRLRWSILT